MNFHQQTDKSYAATPVRGSTFQVIDSNLGGWDVFYNKRWLTNAETWYSAMNAAENHWEAIQKDEATFPASIFWVLMWAWSVVPPVAVGLVMGFDWLRMLAAVFLWVVASALGMWVVIDRDKRK